MGSEVMGFSSAMRGYLHRDDREGHGFTVTEVLVVAGIFLTVLSVLLTTLEVALRQERRTAAIVDNNLQVTSAIAAMTREIRAANPIETTGITSSDQMRFSLTVSVGTEEAGDSATWRFSVDGQRRLLQERLVNGAVEDQRVLIRELANRPDQPLFRYFDDSGAELTTTGAAAVSPSTVAQCAVRVLIHILSVPEVRGAPIHEATTDVQVRNKLPGGTGC